MEAEEAMEEVGKKVMKFEQGRCTLLIKVDCWH